MRLEELIEERDDPRLSVVVIDEGDEVFGSESAGRYLSIGGHLWPEPAEWREHGTTRDLLVGFFEHALAMVTAHEAGLRTIITDAPDP